MTPSQNNANKFIKLEHVSFLDSDKMKQIKKVPSLSKHFPLFSRKAFLLFILQKGKMKISTGGPNRARMFIEGNSPICLE